MNGWEWQLLEDKTPLDHIVVSGVELRVGGRVRLLPRKGGDILDIALQGQEATVESLEEDYEGKPHVCVVLDADPGRDLGLLRQPGHRFFFDASEVEPLPPDMQHPALVVQKPSILVAGIGNIFLGDDGFGVEVAQRLCQRQFPSAVRVADFGIRGLDLAYALQDGYSTAILIDAFPHGGPPGTVYVVELDLNDATAFPASANVTEAHAMDPMSVLRMAAAMRGPLKRVLLVGAEPESFGGADGRIGLSAPLEAAVGEALQTTEKWIHKILAENSARAD